jgi:hypothetical protein
MPVTTDQLLGILRKDEYKDVFQIKFTETGRAHSDRTDGVRFVANSLMPEKFTLFFGDGSAYPSTLLEEKDLIELLDQISAVDMLDKL